MGICLGSLGVPRGVGLFGRARYPCRTLRREIGNLLPNNRRHRRTCYALCHILYPVSAADTSIFRMDSNSTSYWTLRTLHREWPLNELVLVHSGCN